MTVCRLYAQPNTLTPGDHRRSSAAVKYHGCAQCCSTGAQRSLCLCHTLGFYFYRETDKFKETAGLGKRSQDRVSHVAFQKPGSVNKLGHFHSYSNIFSSICFTDRDAKNQEKLKEKILLLGFQNYRCVARFLGVSV